MWRRLAPFAAGAAWLLAGCGAEIPAASWDATARKDGAVVLREDADLPDVGGEVPGPDASGEVDASEAEDAGMPEEDAAVAAVDAAVEEPGPDASLDPADAGPAGADAGDADAAVTGPDGGATTPAAPFLAGTSGGARLSSASYRLELFVAPQSPAASRSTSNYRIQLGPGALRSAQ